MHIEQYGWSISAGRFDQYMLPLLPAGPRERRAVARAGLGVAAQPVGQVHGERGHAGSRRPTFQNLTLGGQDAEGRDQSNALSRLCLDATVALRIQPAGALRALAPQHRPRLLGAGAPGDRPGTGHAGAVQRRGDHPRAGRARRAAARTRVGYGIVGCVEACVPGKQQGVTAGGHINVAKALELALNEGRSMITRRADRPAHPAPGDFRRLRRPVARLCGAGRVPGGAEHPGDA